MMQDVSLAASFGRLGVVAALMVAVFFLLRRVSGKGRSKTTRAAERPLELIDRQALGKSQSVAVFKLHDYTLVVGVTEQRVELLSLIDPAEGETRMIPAEPSTHAAHAADHEIADDVLDLARIELDDETERFLDRLRSRSAR
jgi:flagellar biogenesis protein FliO